MCIVACVGDKSVRLLPRATALDDRAPDVYTVTGPDGKKISSYVTSSTGGVGPASRADFVALEPGKAVAKSMRLYYDFGKPGAYTVSASITRGAGDLAAYYAGDATGRQQNPDNVWTGTIAAAPITINVVRPGQKPPNKEAVAPTAYALNPYERYTPRELQLQLALDTKISFDFELPTDLKEVIEFINEVVKAQTGIANVLHLDPHTVAGQARQVPMIQRDIPLRNALALILLDASTDAEIAGNNELGYYADRNLGVVYITNQPRLLALKMRDKEFRFYDVRDLLDKFPVGGR
jgi:hypothetical protein